MSSTANISKNRRKRKKKKDSVLKYVHKEVTLSGTEMKRDGIKEQGKKRNI